MVRVLEPTSTFASAVREITAALVDEYDTIAMLTDIVERIAAVLGEGDAGIMVADRDRQLRLISSSTERLRELELFEIQNSEGPCPEAFSSGKEILDRPLDNKNGAWPEVVELAESLGYRRASAFPLRARSEVIGAINLFMPVDRALRDDELVIVRTLADLATLAVTQDRSANVVAQLQRALDGRVIIEQAKGLLAGRLGIEVDEAFERLRTYSRCNNRRLSDVASDLLEGNAPVELRTD